MAESARDPRPPFHSERLRAEPVCEHHAARMVAVLRDPAIYRFLEGGPPSLAQLTRYYRFLAGGVSPDRTERWLTWIVIDSDTERPLGYTQATILADATALVAYVLAPPFWGRGYAREAVSALLDLLLSTLRVRRAVAEIDVRHRASIALVERLGFERTELAKTTPGHSELRFVLEDASWPRSAG